MSERQRLPNKRRHDVVEFEFEGVQYKIGSGTFPDGSLSELFINAGKVGSAVDVMSREAAVLFSIARQYGVPIETLRDALPKLADGISAAGPVGRALELIMRE